MIKPKSITNWEYALIAGNYASMYEIRYLLSVWDVLDLIEIMTIKESNSKIVMDQMSNKSKR